MIMPAYLTCDRLHDESGQGMLHISLAGCICFQALLCVACPVRHHEVKWHLAGVQGAECIRGVHTSGCAKLTFEVNCPSHALVPTLASSSLTCRGKPARACVCCLAGSPPAVH